jgi:hypothetical protein
MSSIGHQSRSVRQHDSAAYGRISQHQAKFLTPAHERAALLKAINRTRRVMKRRAGLSPANIAVRFWLLLAAARTKQGSPILTPRWTRSPAFMSAICNLS